MTTKTTMTNKAITGPKNNLRDRVQETISASDRPLTRCQIQFATRATGQRLAEALGVLLRRGIISVSEVPSPGRKVRLYSMK